MKSHRAFGPRPAPGIAPRLARRLLLAAALGSSAAMGGGCAIPDRDPLAGFGARCVVAEGSCDVEHVCRPEEPGADVGTCVPVASYGACDAEEPVRHRPGERAEAKVDVEITIDGPEDLPLIENIRAVTGQVRVFKQGAGNAQIGSLCSFRDLQQAGDGLGIGDSDVTSLDGLQSFTSAQSGLAIFDNRRLEDLDGLANLVDITPRQLSDLASFDLVIAGNTALADDVVDAFVTALEERVGRSLAVIACDNGGRACEGVQAQLVDLLIVNGLSPR